MQFSTKLLALALSATFGAAALAQGTMPDSTIDAATKRALVRADAAAAVAAGQIPRGEGSPMYPTPFRSALARGDVRADTVAAMAAGQIPRGERGTLIADTFVAQKTRAEVGAETVVAMRLGLIPRGEAPARQPTAAEVELIRLAGERARAADPRLAAR
jgi:hypothetical protein